MNKYLLTFLLLGILTGISYAQVNRYLVFFTDKDNSTYSIKRPLEFLSARSVERRQKFNIQITDNDLPVNQDYISAIRASDIITYYQTKWFNGILVECSDVSKDSLLLLPFVRNIEYVAPGMQSQLIFSNTDTDMDLNIYSQRDKALKNEVQNNMLGIDVMHEQGYDGSGIIIAVTDAGFTGLDKSDYFSHLFSDNKIIGTRDFVSGSSSVFSHDSHGTEVMSCMAAFKAGEYEASAYNSDYILCITEDDPTEYRIEEYNWVFAAEYADSLGADIINTSLGYNTFDDSTMNYTFKDMDGKTAVITRAAEMAANKGMLCVVSVGNEGNISWQKLVAPADGDSVLSVGAVGSNLEKAFFSSDGPSADGRIKPDVAALGTNVSIISIFNTETKGDGTSYSAPLVTGLAAGVWQAYPYLSNMDLLEVIEKGSSRFNSADTLIGYGIPDFKKIQTLITSLSENIPAGIFKVYPNPVENKRLFIELNSAYHSNDMAIEIIDMEGKSCLTKSVKMDHDKNKIELNLEKLTPGIYILYLDSSAGKGNVRILVP